MIPRLRHILKNSYGFVKYMKSLDFDEFKLLFVWYMKVVMKYERIYLKQNPKRFSKNWFINRKIKKRYHKLYRIFSVAKPGYITKISSDMGELNKFKEGVLNEFIETKKIIDNLTKQTLSITEGKPTRADIIKINAMMIDSIYLNDRLQYLSEELDKFKK